MTVTVQLRSASGATLTKTLSDPVVWADNDVGAPAVAGSASLAANVFTIKGGGTNIWGTVDQLHFVHLPLAGDGQIVARVTSQTGATNTWAKAGVMIKQSTTSGSPYALMTVTPDVQGTAFQAGFSQNVQTTAKAWLKLTRVGSVVTGHASSDGTTWSQLGTFTLSGAARIGLFVCACSGTQLCTATFDRVTVGAVK
jgi:ribosomal protein S11